MNEDRININYNCTDCNTDKKQKEEDQDVEDSKYQRWNEEITIAGKTYAVNARRTVIKGMVEDLDNLKKFIVHNSCIPTELQELNEMDIELIKRDYPEWVKTKELNRINGNPQKYFYQKDKPLIIVFEVRIYFVMPILRGE